MCQKVARKIAILNYLFVKNSPRRINKNGQYNGLTGSHSYIGKSWLILKVTRRDLNNFIIRFYITTPFWGLLLKYNVI